MPAARAVAREAAAAAAVSRARVATGRWFPVVEAGLEGGLTRAKALETREVLAAWVDAGKVVVVTETGEEESLRSDEE